MLYNVEYFWSQTKEDYDNGRYSICNADDLIEADSSEEAIEIFKQCTIDMIDQTEWDVWDYDDRIVCESRFYDVPAQVYWNFTGKVYE